VSERPLLAAIGAFTLAQILGQGAIFLLWGQGAIAFRGPVEFEAALFPAAVAGAVVAMPTRDPKVLLAYLLYALTFPSIAFARTAVWWGQAASAGDPFRRPVELLEAVLQHWPLALGVLVGLLFLLLPRTRLAASAALQAGGVFGLGLMLLGLGGIAFLFFASPAPLLQGAFVALQLAIALATGVFLAGRWRSALLVAATLALGWLPLGYLQAEVFLAQGGPDALRFFVPPAMAALVALASLPRWRRRADGLALTRA
jgi:hypothetical protein